MYKQENTFMFNALLKDSLKVICMLCISRVILIWVFFCPWSPWTHHGRGAGREVEWGKNRWRDRQLQYQVCLQKWDYRGHICNRDSEETLRSVQAGQEVASTLILETAVINPKRGRAQGKTDPEYKAIYRQSGWTPRKVVQECQVDQCTWSLADEIVRDWARDKNTNRVDVSQFFWDTH